MSKESALPYGGQLYKAVHQAVTIEVNDHLQLFVQNPGKARAHAAAFPYLDQMRGPQHIAAVALIAGLDQLSRRQTYATFAQMLGLSTENELRLLAFEAKAGVEYRFLRSNSGLSRKQLAKPQLMNDVGVYYPRWTDKTRLMVGLFLADCLLSSTELFTCRMHKQGIRRIRMVGPSDQALALIKASRVSAITGGHGAMVCRPQPWHSLWDGGLLEQNECLIRLPIHDAENQETASAHYRATDMSWLLKVVNHLQETPLTVSGQMVELQRIAWEAGFDGLWPCARAPMEPPPMLGNDPDPAELKARNRLASIAHRDREQNRPRRIKIERALQQAEELKDRTIWQAYQADHRGRLYTWNRYTTHQGPDFEKAQLSLQPLPVGTDGIDWILKAAAGHYGLSQASWADRLQWGADHREQMVAAADDPLNRLELWRSAKDPWQYLQLCRGLKEALQTGATGVPIRFDQTTSGCGILAALVRDKGIGRLCNLYGSTRQDFYSTVADAVRLRLQRDLEFGETSERLMAETWLGRGINRGLVKGPVLAVPYGGSYQSVADKLAIALDEHLGFVPIEEFVLRVGLPARYLASHLWAELKDAVAPANAVKSWLKACCKRMMLKGHVLNWTTPMGFPMRANEREQVTIKVNTQLFGKRISVNFADQPDDMPLSHAMANRSLPANFVHSFDAVLVHAIVSRAVVKQMPILTNHDCFAVHACHASELHGLLLGEFRDLYRPDWLAVWLAEIQSETGVKLPPPPTVGDLDVGLIGTNPYLFS